MKNLWQKPNNKNLYDDEVLAIGLQEELIVGYLVEDDDSDTGFGCENDCEYIDDVVSYITITDLIDNFKENKKYDCNK